MTYKISACAGFALLFASPVLAGNIGVPLEIAAPIVAPPVVLQDWSGPYVGGLLSFSSAEGLTELIPGTTVIPNIRFEMSATGYGGFAGYNIQRGAFVFGGEGAITFGGFLFEDPNFNLSYGPLIDLKARAGFSVGNALVYGVVGGAFATASYANLEFPITGFSYGAGVDIALGEHLFVGGEYLIRDLSGTNDTLPAGSTISATIQSAQLRVGWKF